MADLEPPEDQPNSDPETYHRLMHAGLGHLAAAIEALAVQLPAGGTWAVGLVRRAARDFESAAVLRFGPPPEPPPPEAEPLVDDTQSSALPPASEPGPDAPPPPLEPEPLPPAEPAPEPPQPETGTA